MNWENYRRPDLSLDLVQAFLDAMPNQRNAVCTRKAVEYLGEVEDLCPIRSRQAAGVAVAHAMCIARGDL